MNLFKKATASVALVALVSSVFSAGVSANSTSQIEAANALAERGFINNQASAADYNLNQNVLRQEIAKVAANMAGIQAKATCDNSFADVSATTPNTWACGYVEALLDAGAISANTNFRPEDNISKSEAVKMVLEAAGYEDIYTNVNNWQEEVVNFAVEKAIVSSFTNYNTPATRGFIFEAANDAVVSLETETANNEETCDEISQLLGLCGDTTTVDTPVVDNGDTTTTDTPVIVTGNVLEVTLSPETPVSADVPDTVSGVNVMKFDVTAGNEDITINSLSLKREGLGASTAVDSVVLFADNQRISKAKSFNSTTDLAEINVTPALVVMAGETKTITAKVDTGASGKFSISIENVNASSDVELGNVVSNQFEIVSVTTTIATVEADGTVTDPKLGEEQADLLKFKITNGGEANESVELTSITFKDDSSNIDTNVENITLYHNNESVAVVPSVDGKYVTFNFASPIVIAEDKTEKFIVKADIVAGANDSIDLFIDNVLDVTIKSPKNEYATVTVNGSLSTVAALTIQAGQVTIISTDPETDTVLDNKNNVVFGTFEVQATSGKDLYVDRISYDLTTDTTNLNAELENVELYDATNGVSYDPDTAVTTGLTNTFVFSDLDLTIADGSSIEFEIRADVVNGATSGANITASVDVANDVIIKEASDDTVVTDKIPSAITFKDVEVVSADMVINALVQSNTSKVIGSTNIAAFDFEVRANNDASDLTVKELTFEGTATDVAPLNTDGTELSNTRVNALYLYDGDTLLDSKSASELANGQITFDGLNIVVAKNDARTLTVAIDLLDDVNNANDTITLELVGYYVEDSESDNVYITGDTDGILGNELALDPVVTSTRTVTIEGVGTLTVAVDNTDNETDKAKNVIAGSTSDFVASYEFTAINEPVLVKDLQINQTNAGDTLESGVSEIVIYADDMTTEVARQIVTSDTVNFNNINVVIPEGSSNLYVKAVTHLIGKDRAGSQVSDLTLEMLMVDAEGNESGKTVDITASDAATEVGASNAFSVVPVKISAVTSVNTYGGKTVETSLTNGSNTIAIIGITTDSSDNTDSTNGSELKTLLTQIALQEDKLAATTATYTLEKIGGNDGAINGTVALGVVTFDTTALTTDDEIDNATTVYYEVVANVTKDIAADNDDYIQLSFNDLSASNVVYQSNDTVANNTPITDLRLADNTLDFSKISE